MLAKEGPLWRDWPHGQDGPLRRDRPRAREVLSGQNSQGTAENLGQFE